MKEHNPFVIRDVSEEIYHNLDEARQSIYEHARLDFFEKRDDIMIDDWRRYHADDLSGKVGPGYLVFDESDCSCGFSFKYLPRASSVDLYINREGRISRLLYSYQLTDRNERLIAKMLFHQIRGRIQKIDKDIKERKELDGMMPES